MVTDAERNYEDLIDDDKEDVGRGHWSLYLVVVKVGFGSKWWWSARQAQLL